MKTATVEIPPGRKFVHLCAWCAGAKEKTEALRRSGYTVSHGICATHKAEALKQLETLNLKGMFK